MRRSFMSKIRTNLRLKLNRFVLGMLFFGFVANDINAQFTSGGIFGGAITSAGQTDGWNFEVTTGERIVLRTAQLSGTNGFIAYARVYNTSGELAGGTYGGVSEYALTATNSGTYTVVIGDGNPGNIGTGSYRFHFAKLPGPFVISPGDDGGPLPESGGIQTGFIGERGDMDLWTFPVVAGERIVLRAAQITSTDNFVAQTRIYNSSGVLAGQLFSSVDEYAFTATNSGLYTLLIADGNNNWGRIGTGQYRFHIAKLPGPFVVMSGDDGGPLPGNGGSQSGVIGERGDLDLWSFPATTGEQVILRAAQLTSTNNLITFTRIYNPEGVLMGNMSATSEFTLTATNTGTYTLLIADGNNGWGRIGTGEYRYTIAKTSGPITVLPGDEGGNLTNGVSQVGTIEVGDIDAWTFNLCAGDGFALQLNELTGGAGLLLQMQLYGRDGMLLNTASGQTSAQISRIAPATGTYVLLIKDVSGSLSGTGTYQLTGTGISSGLTFCAPIRVGTNMVLNAPGGTANAAAILLTATNLALPQAQWLPVATNHFDQYGVFSGTNAFQFSEPAMFFRLREEN